MPAKDRAEKLKGHRYTAFKRGKDPAFYPHTGAMDATLDANLPTDSDLKSESQVTVHSASLGRS